MSKPLVIAFDAKRIVSNATGLGSYGRTLVNDLTALDASVQWRLYAPSAGRDDLRGQIVSRACRFIMVFLASYRWASVAAA